MGMIETEIKKQPAKLKVQIVINDKIYTVTLPFIPKIEDVMETAKDRFMVKKVIYVEKDDDFLPRIYLQKELSFIFSL